MLQLLSCEARMPSFPSLKSIATCAYEEFHYFSQQSVAMQLYLSYLALKKQPLNLQQRTWWFRHISHKNDRFTELQCKSPPFYLISPDLYSFIIIIWESVLFGAWMHFLDTKSVAKNDIPLLNLSVDESNNANNS